MTAAPTAEQVMRAAPAPEGRRSDGRTLPQLLRDNARTWPEHAALKPKRDGIWRPMTWAEVWDEVRMLARGLAALGLGRDETLGFISENIAEQWLLELAALTIGARVVSVYPDATSNELAHALDASRADMVMGEDQEQVDKILACLSQTPRIRQIIFVNGRGLWSYAETKLISLDQVRRGGEGFESQDWAEAQATQAIQTDIAAICFTSGTTGKPKAALLSHAFILDNAHRLMGSLQVRPGSDYLSYISPAWAAEQFFGVGLPLLAPMVVHFAEKPETVQRDLREIGPEFLMFTPRQWEMQASDVEARMMDASRWRQRLFAWGLAQGLARVRGNDGILSRLILWPLAEQLVLKGVRDMLGLTRSKAVLSGGSGLSAELFERFRAFGVPLGNLYGSSELGLISTHGPGRQNPETMGALMPSDPTITDPIEAWVAPNGELRLRALAFSGYLGAEDATAEMGDRDQGYLTGDAVRLNPTGELIFLDRLKDLRRLSTGQTYPPQFIENHLRASPMIRDAIVIGDEDRDRVVALINIDSGIAGRFAESRGLAFGTFPELSQLPDIRAEAARAVVRVNALLDPGARIAAFANLPKELDADEAELTRSRKLRREQIHARYGAIIEGLYRGDRSIESEIEVRYQDGAVGTLRTSVALERVGEPGSGAQAEAAE